MKDSILKVLQEKKIPLDIDELASILKLEESHDFIELAKTLNQLEDEYLIIHNKKNKFQTLEYFYLMVGTFKYHRRMNEVINDNKSIDVSHDNSLGAITNDLVMVDYRSNPKITRIIKRGNKKIIGILKTYHRKAYVESIDSSINLIIDVDDNGYSIGDYVKVRIDKYYPNRAKGTITNLVAKRNDPNGYYKALIANNDLYNKYSDEILLELNEINEKIDEEEYNKRRIVNRTIITIDGEDAKDLDDAVSVERLEDGNYLLGVYIADVSYYVKENSFLDLEAFDKGASIYFPGMVIPMLPEKLSNNLCSLKPHTDKLAMAIEMTIDKSGEVINQDIFEAIISTKYRMTYNEVYEILNGDEELIDSYKDIVELLNTSKELASILKEKRKNRGAFFFETAETEFILDKDNKVLDLSRKSYTIANSIIEEFMIVANETVATTMNFLDVPFIYRVHESPSADKIDHLMANLRWYHYDQKFKNDNQLKLFLQKVINENDPNEEGIEEFERIKRDVINTLLIRSMAKSKYSGTNLGHFGLASSCYTHFTSPIRRYPDLLVHRLIKTFLLNKPEIDDYYNYYSNKVINSSTNSSKMEVLIDNIERDADDYKKCEYASTLIDQVFYGTISYITSFGFYVILDNTIEGLVHISSLMDDYYDYDSDRNILIGDRTGKEYSLGNRVKIKIIEVNKEKRQIDFIIR